MHQPKPTTGRSAFYPPGLGFHRGADRLCLRVLRVARAHNRRARAVRVAGETVRFRNEIENNKRTGAHPSFCKKPNRPKPLQGVSRKQYTIYSNVFSTFTTSNFNSGRLPCHLRLAAIFRTR